MPRQARLLETSVSRSTLAFTVRDGALLSCGFTHTNGVDRYVEFIESFHGWSKSALGGL
jgi:hypothetical protein